VVQPAKDTIDALQLTIDAEIHIFLLLKDGPEVTKEYG
jgi:hypothetical protein